jgi:ATP-dependent DNA helicase RecG
MGNPESQHTEWKESWRDEYIKWICGFANAQGGTLYIGKDDRGQVVGLENSRRLLEDIPNKVRDLLGILVDVNMRTEGELEYLEIVVEPYPYPVSYKGQYHYRSGSTKQELRGAALDRFLLQKQGKRWDGVPLPHVSVNDLKADTFEAFRKRAFRSKRVDEEVLRDSNASLLENLHLTEGEYLKRAAILLFHPNPERFITGAYVKIGYFETDDLRYQDEVHGNLMEQIEKVLDLLQKKYFKANIRYEGAQRVEAFAFRRQPSGRGCSMPLPTRTTAEAYPSRSACTRIGSFSGKRGSCPIAGR